MYKQITGAAVCAAIATVAYAAAPASAPAERVSQDWTEDATRTYYNAALKLPWGATMGTWRDRTGAAQGTLPFASTPVVDRASEQVVQWDVTSLVRANRADMMVRRVGGTNIKFHSGEAADAAKRPRLVVWKDGQVYRYAPTADTSLNSTTDSSLGNSTVLSTTGGFLIKFNVGADSGIQRAVLEMTATTEQYGNQTLNVFKADARPKTLTAPTFVRGTTSDIVLKLSGAAWKTAANGSFVSSRMTINPNGSLTVKIPTGDDMGSQMLYSIPKAARRDAMYSRAIMKVHADWKGTMGGKYPGLSNTGMGDDRATQCGWGGRVANGTCWSARTNRRGYVPGTQYADTHQGLSPYTYRVNRSTSNGEGPAFSKPIPKNQFFVLDQMVKLNGFNADGSAKADGVVAYWLNGELIGHMSGVILRTNASADTLPSEYWLDVYEGGVGYLAPHPHTVTFHEVTVSSKLLPYDAARLATINSAGS